MNGRPFARPVRRWHWYFKHSRYRSYMLREATCFLVAIYCLLVIAGLSALVSNESQAWETYLARQQHPAWVAFHALALVLFIFYQTVPWFRLAPRAMPLQLGQLVISPSIIITAHYLVWFIVTALIFFLLGVF